MAHQLNALIEAARKIEMTPEMQREQRQSFAFGNVSMHNPDVTRELIAKADAKIEAETLDGPAQR